MAQACAFLPPRYALLMCFAVCCGWAQLPGPSPQNPSRVVPLPLSGNTSQAASVAAQQSASPVGGVSTVDSSVQVGGALSGSAPATSLPPGPIALSLADAVKLALRWNLGPITADASARAARAERIQALSALLPNISVNASDTVSQVNLAAYGFQFKIPPGLNFSIPSVVGPFNYSSLEGSMNLSVYDAVQRRNWQAAKQTERAMVLSAKDTRELVALAAGGSYLQTVATAARVASQQAQVNNAQAIYNQAVVRKQAGTNARIDVTRSLVEFQTEQQRLSSLQADLRKQKISLARIIGLPLGRELNLTDKLRFETTTLPDTDESIQRALQHRADVQAAEAQMRAAEQQVSAARAERFPSVTLGGDYGVIGANPVSTHGVFAVTGSLNVPVWQGGRIKGDIQQAEATLYQRQAELADQRGRVEQDVRTALIELQTALGQVQLAESNRNYANDTLSQARDRFNAGVATTVEVVQAQEQVANAESDYISSLFSFNLARLTLARATGEAEAETLDLLKGSRP
jgi:outer membrane protein TolC